MPAPEVETSPRSISAYLSLLDRWRYPPSGDLTGSADHQHYSGWRRVVLRVLPDSLILQIRVIATRVMMRSPTNRIRATNTSLCLHLGCGEHRIPGWVNVDLCGARADFLWDLRRPLPVRPGTVGAIFHEHLLEHLPLPDALGFLRQCEALLEPGGILRIGVPDFRAHVRSYVDRDGYLDELRPGRPTPLLALNELVYSYGHASMWDSDTLRVAMEEVGLRDVRERPFGESQIGGPAPDSADRRDGTLYVEAVKPRD